LLASGDVSVLGTIDVSGSNAPSFLHEPGRGGPGGFDGGWPGNDTLSAGNGYGPGGGGGGVFSLGILYAIVGSGSYGAQASSSYTTSTNLGAIYGSPLLVPMVGGSGGGGTIGSPGSGGGGGGGAILIASNTQITNGGSIIANGGEGYLGSGSYHYNSGSGGAIRIVAPVVAGSGVLSAAGPGG